MIITRQKEKQLEEEIALLEEERRRLKQELTLATETELYKTAKSYSYRDSLLLYRMVPISMITTPFYQKRELLAKKATACFLPGVIKGIKNQADFALDFNPQLHFAMYCEKITPTPDGIQFVLSDPYRTIQTYPVDISESEVLNYVGKLVIATLIIPENYEKEQLFTLTSIKATSYASDYLMKHEDWTLLQNLTTVSGSDECIHALHEVEIAFSNKYPNTPEKRTHHASWVHENEFRITTDNRLMCFHIKNGIIWYADELRTPDELGPYSIALSYAMYHSFSEIFGNSSTEDIPLLLSGEENFELFEKL